MKAVEQMLFATLSGDATLSTLAPGGVWRGVAPETAEGTVVVFSQVSGLDTYTLADRAFTRSTYQVKAITPGPSSAPAWAAADRVDVLLNDAALTLTTGSVMACRRESVVSLDETDGGEQYQHAGGTYTITTQE